MKKIKVGIAVLVIAVLIVGYNVASDLFKMDSTTATTGQQETSEATQAAKEETQETSEATQKTDTVDLPTASTEESLDREPNEESLATEPVGTESEKDEDTNNQEPTVAPTKGNDELGENELPPV